MTTAEQRVSQHSEYNAICWFTCFYASSVRLRRSQQRNGSIDSWVYTVNIRIAEVVVTWRGNMHYPLHVVHCLQVSRSALLMNIPGARNLLGRRRRLLPNPTPRLGSIYRHIAQKPTLCVWIYSTPDPALCLVPGSQRRGAAA